MGAWGENAFESDGGLDFLDNFADGLFGDVTLGGLAATTEEALGQHEDASHAAGELMAAALSTDWSAYRVGGGSGVMGPRTAGRPVWLPEDAANLAIRLRSLPTAEAFYAVRSSEGFIQSAEALALRLEGYAAKTRDEDWSAALVATAARLRAALS